jgi:hypothetical protein
MLISSETRSEGHKRVKVKDNGLHHYKNIINLLKDCDFETTIGKEYKGKTSKGHKFHWIPILGKKQVSS